MKKKLQTLLLLFIGFITVCPALRTAYAEEKEQILFTITQEQDITVTLVYDYEDIRFELISPSGQRITKDTDTETITVYYGKKSTIIFLGQAEIGTWKIKYDKGSNQSIGIRTDVQDTEFFISDLKTKEASENSLPVSFLVSGKEGTGYEYVLSATIGTDSMNGKELLRGTARTGHQVDVTVPLQMLNSYEEYRLLLHVSYRLDEKEIFDFKFSEDTFAYHNPETPKALEDIEVCIEHDLSLLTFSWEKYCPAQAQSVFLRVTQGDTELYSNEIQISNGTNVEVPFETSGQYHAEISYKNVNGMVSECMRKTINTDAAMVRLPDNGIARSEQWSVFYENAEDTPCQIEVNGQSIFFQWNGSGSEVISLTDERNRIVLTYRDTQGIMHCYRRNANVYVVVPEIILSRQIDKVQTKETSILISGTTNAETLKINDVIISTDRGEFIYQYPLKAGRNDLVMEAMIGDRITIVNAAVYREGKIPGSSFYLLVGFLVSVAGITVLMLLMWIQKKLKNKMILPLGMVWILTAVLWFAWWKAMRYTNSSEYLLLSYRSLSEAVNALEFCQKLFYVTVAITAAAGVCTVICGAILFVKWKRRGMNEKAQ